MDHLEHLNGSIDGHHDMLKGSVRSTMQSGESGSLPFITSSGMAHSGREQEYIESTLLSSDLLSSHLPANFLNDYINSVSSSAPNSMGSMQSALMEHHYRSFTSDELHTLGNEPNNESTAMGNGSKDIPGFSTLSSYDKIISMGQSTSPISNGLAQIAGTIDAFVHFPLPGAGLHATGAGHDGFDVVTNTLVSAHPHVQMGQQQQHYNLPHASNTHHLHQHQAQGQMHHHQNLVEMTNPGTQQLPSLGHAETSTNLSSLLPSVEVSIKPYCNNNSTIPIASTAPCRTDVPNSSTTMTPIATMRLSDSPKRYYSCATLPSLITHNQRTPFSIAESLVSTKNVAPSVIQCEARTQSEEEIPDCVASMETTPCALLGNINLPHKKRLAKKLGDTKEGVCNGNAEIDQSLLVGNMQPSQHVSSAAVTENESIQRTNPSDQDQSSAHQNRNGSVKSDAGKANDAQQTSLPQSLPTFSCQLCGKQVQDQLLFFNHLKEHYEPSVARSTGSADSVNSSAMVVKNVATSPADTMPAHEKLTSSADSKKAKPKLPRVKHTKKLKNDRALKQTIVEPENLATLQKIESKPTPMATSSSTASKGTVGVLLQKAELSDAMVAIECSLNGGEFSETEDMLEGIRNVVQKVQETVDTDTTEELCIADNRTWFPAANDDKVISDSITSTLMPQTEKGSLDLAGDALDTHGIHIQNAGDNFLLLLSKTQFNDADLLQTETSDSSLLKPLDPSTCEQLTHTSSLVEPNRNENYVAGEQNLQQLQPTLHSATFPLLSTVDSTSFRVNESLSMSSILELIPSATEKLPAEISSNSYGPSPCVHVPEQKNTELLKNEQKPNDYDEGGDGEGDANYNSLQFATNIDAPDMNPPLDDIPPGDAHDEQTGEDYSFSGEELDEQTNEEHTESQEHLGEDDKDSSFDGASNSKLNKFLCTQADCGRQFKSKTAFSYHQLQHTGERPYKCKACEKCFFTCSALKVHERLHSGEKPYKCDECGHDFRQWGDLKYHKISKHSNEKSHKCEFCGKEFARRYSLVLHRRIHTNEKNYVCEYCKKGFRASTYLQAHRMIHTGEKPHQCSVCDKKFRCHGDLNRHQKTHTRFGGKTVDDGERKSDDDSVGMQVDSPETAPEKPVKTKLSRKSIASKNNNSIVTV